MKENPILFWSWWLDTAHSIMLKAATLTAISTILEYFFKRSLGEWKKRSLQSSTFWRFLRTFCQKVRTLTSLFPKWDQTQILGQWLSAKQSSCCRREALEALLFHIWTKRAWLFCFNPSGHTASVRAVIHSTGGGCTCTHPAPTSISSQSRANKNKNSAVELEKWNVNRVRVRVRVSSVWTSMMYCNLL